MSEPRKIRALLIDDEEIILRIGKNAAKEANRRLRPSSFHIDLGAAADVDGAIEEVLRTQPDICLVDYKLGGESCERILAVAREHTFAVVAVLSGLPLSDFCESIWISGTRRCLRKGRATEIRKQPDLLTKTICDFLLSAAEEVDAELSQRTRYGRQGALYRIGSNVFQFGRPQIWNSRGTPVPLGRFQQLALEELCLYPREPLNRQVLVEKLRTPSGNVSNKPLFAVIADLNDKLGGELRLRRGAAGNFHLEAEFLLMLPEYAE